MRLADQPASGWSSGWVRATAVFVEMVRDEDAWGMSGSDAISLISGLRLEALRPEDRVLNTER